MFDWIPLEYYTLIFYNVILLIAFALYGQLRYSGLNTRTNYDTVNSLGVFFLLLLVLYMGLRPISRWHFADMATYNTFFEINKSGIELNFGTDWLYNVFMKFSAKFMTAHQFFLVMDVLYIIPIFLFSKKYFAHFWFYAFFMFVASFSFWGFGTNGLRNGLGTSFFIWGLCYYNKKIIMYAFFVLGFLWHSSIFLPIVAFIGAYFLINRPKLMVYIWLAAIPISFIAGEAATALFEGLGIAGGKADVYLTGKAGEVEQFTRSGFRWDFILYSALPIVIGWYFIIIKGLKDRLYIHILGTYLLANAVWIMVIRASFTNRFAYLSWFLMAPLIIYPLLKYTIVSRQALWVAVIIVGYALITYGLFWFF